MEHNEGLYAIAIGMVISTVILSASVIYVAGGISSNLQQINGNLANLEISVGSNIATGQQLQPQAQPTQQPQATPQATGGRVDFQGIEFEGSEEAKFVLVEYSDFQCPFCRRFYTETLSQIEQNYVDTGKIRFAYKHFPLDQIHPGARPAAQGFECARDQDLHWEYHDAVFDEQGKQGQGTVSFSSENIKGWAEQIEGLDKDKFNSCLDSGEKNSIVQAHLQEGIANGIGGTPGFLITDSDGNVLTGLSGAQPYEVFQQALTSVGA